jgi:uncharacterized protein (DUF1330 family)
MSAYMIVDVDIKDPVLYQEYTSRVPAIIRKHRGEVLVRGGSFVILEGQWNPHSLVVLRFPDLASAQAFYDDPEYQPLIAIRQPISQMNMIVVEGN